MKSLIILNPSSNGGKAIAALQELEETLKHFKIDYTIHISKSSDDVKDTVGKGMENFSSFISAGGDGTIHTIANILAGTDKNLGCIPMGSGNDISKNLGIPADFKTCCRIIRDCNTRRIDLGLINNRYYYLAVSGAGFDSVVNDLANNTKFPIKGPAKYTYAVYKTLITYRAKKFFIKYNGISRTLEAMFCVAGNMPTYGGGMKIVPEADPSDGILDICVIKKMSKIHFIKTFPSVFEGNHINDPFVECFKTKSFEIDSEYNFSVFADGEYICKLPARYDVAPRALNFIV